MPVLRKVILLLVSGLVPQQKSLPEVLHIRERGFDLKTHEHNTLVILLCQKGESKKVQSCETSFMKDPKTIRKLKM